MGVNYNTIPARLGDVFANDLFAMRCPANSSPETDSCDSEGGGLPIGSGGSPGTGGASSSGGKGGAADSGAPDASSDASQN